MKLFPALVATLLQEAKSQTCDGNPVFAVTCHEDLVVELTVNKPCLTEKFPFVSITELQINPTDAAGNVPEDANGNSLQCLPCTTLPCSESANFMAYDFWDANPTAVAVDDNSASLFFKAGQCGTSMTISADETKAIFKTDIGKPAEVDATTGIVTETTLLETDITCEYPSTISDIAMDPGMSVIADASQDSDKISQDANPDAVSDSLFTMETKERNMDTGATGAVITSSDDVTLGDGVRIAVTATDAAITDFYLGDCVADNGEDQFQADGTTPNVDYRSLQIVTGGCMESLGSLENEIEASMTGKELIFKQFAFADESQAALTLTFQVTCDIILGEAPTDADCLQRKTDGDSSLTDKAGRRRRATRRAAAEYSETTKYQVTAGSKIAEVSDNGIVVAHSGSGKASDEDAESGAVSAAVAIMAGTAVMLL
jgi:hypothetical protein